jgi:hypothetical protein
MKIFIIRIGDKYGPEYEDYIESKLSHKYDIHWIREEKHPGMKMQWNKMWVMGQDIDEPVCTMDIDMLLINDYEKVFDYPIERGQFAAMPGWWRETLPQYKINGGFYKFYPSDTKYIYEELLNNLVHWQRYYIDEGITTGQYNGEQNFVEDMVDQRLEKVVLPAAWFARMESRTTYDGKYHKWISRVTEKYQEASGNPYMFLGDEFHEDIKVVHFTHMHNLPHLWDKYSLFVD